jgi:hypothetical protein
MRLEDTGDVANGSPTAEILFLLGKKMAKAAVGDLGEARTVDETPRGRSTAAVPTLSRPAQTHRPSGHSDLPRPGVRERGSQAFLPRFLGSPSHLRAFFNDPFHHIPFTSNSSQPVRSPHSRTRKQCGSPGDDVRMGGPVCDVTSPSASRREGRNSGTLRLRPQLSRPGLG